MPTQDALGLMLLQEGAVTEAQLYDAMQMQRQDGKSLAACLLKLAAVSADLLLDAQSRVLDIPALPPGELLAADPAALQRVPAALALRLRVVPYSWDGDVLGVAFADEQTLTHLGEVAEAAQAAVGAYVALESDVDAALVQLYPADQPAKPALVIRGLPPPATAKPLALERVSFYDATAQLYEAKSLDAMGQCFAAALLNYFCRVLVFCCEADQLRLCAFAGVQPNRKIIPLVDLPVLQASFGQPLLRYGQAAEDPRAVEVTDALRLQGAPTALFAYVGQERLLIYADNGANAEIYEDIHDVELLLREGATALGMQSRGS